MITSIMEGRLNVEEYAILYQIGEQYVQFWKALNFVWIVTILKQLGISYAF